jgi:hypothetical protein
MEENLKQHKADIINSHVWSREYWQNDAINTTEYYKTEWVPEFALIILQQNGITAKAFVMSMI